MSLHVVFSAECNHTMTWQAVGLFHSHRAVRQPGNITRLLACSPEQLAEYNGLDAGRTFVHHNMRFGHPLIDETGYPSYNKPASVMFWLQAVDVQEQFVALLDADMLLTQPLDPVSLGARRGVVVSAEYSYLVGTAPPFAERFLPSDAAPLAARCGGFHIFHREDIRVIAPLWIEYTKRVRAFAKESHDAYMDESFLDWSQLKQSLPAVEQQVRRRQALWQAEMYGYAFGAAAAGVSTIVRRDTMLYPGYVPYSGIPPAILHYGSDFQLDSMLPGIQLAAHLPDAVPSPQSGYVEGNGQPFSAPLHFNKMEMVDLDLYNCATSRPDGQGYFFLRVPSPADMFLGRSQRDLLAIQALRLLNAAFCEFYRAHCSGRSLVCPDDQIAEPVLRYWARATHQAGGRRNGAAAGASLASSRYFSSVLRWADPSSPKVSAWDAGACNPRGDDVSFDAAVVCGDDGRMVVARLAGDGRRTLAVDGVGCGYHAFVVHECWRDGVEPGARMSQALVEGTGEPGTREATPAFPRLQVVRRQSTTQGDSPFDLPAAEVEASDLVEVGAPSGRRSALSYAIVVYCSDASTRCAAFAEAGECARNMDYMLAECRVSCGLCDEAGVRLLSHVVGPQTYHGPLAQRLRDERLERRSELVSLLRRTQLVRSMRRLAAERGCAPACALAGARIRYTLVHSTVAPAQEDAACGVDDGLNSGGEDSLEGVRPSTSEAVDASQEPERVAGTALDGVLPGGAVDFGFQLGCAKIRAPLVVASGDICHGPYSAGERFLDGSVALIQDGGGCPLSEQALAAQRAGAVGALIYDPSAGVEELFGASQLRAPEGVSEVVIPVLRVTRKAAEELLAALRSAHAADFEGAACSTPSHSAAGAALERDEKPPARAEVQVALQGFEVLIEAAPSNAGATAGSEVISTMRGDSKGGVPRVFIDTPGLIGEYLSAHDEESIDVNCYTRTG